VDCALGWWYKYKRGEDNQIQRVEKTDPVAQLVTAAILYGNRKKFWTSLWSVKQKYTIPHNLHHQAD